MKSLERNRMKGTYWIDGRKTRGGAPIMGLEKLADDMPRGSDDHDVVLAAADQLRRALRRTLGAAEPGTLRETQWRSIRPAVRAFAAAYRQRDTAPEATLVAFKRTICEAVPSANGLRVNTSPEDEHEVLDTMVRWCIEDYYIDDDSDPEASRRIA
jgi:hypothetical protein